MNQNLVNNRKHEHQLTDLKKRNKTFTLMKWLLEKRKQTFLRLFKEEQLEDIQLCRRNWQQKILDIFLIKAFIKLGMNPSFRNSAQKEIFKAYIGACLSVYFSQKILCVKTLKYSQKKKSTDEFNFHGFDKCFSIS